MAVLNNFGSELFSFFFLVCSPVVRHAAGAAGAAIHQGVESGIAKTFDHRAGRQGQLWFAGQIEEGKKESEEKGRLVVCHTLIEWSKDRPTDWLCNRILSTFYLIRRRYAKDCWRRPRPPVPGYSLAAPTPVSIPFHLSFMKGHCTVFMANDYGPVPRLPESNLNKHKEKWARKNKQQTKEQKKLKVRMSDPSRKLNK